MTPISMIYGTGLSINQFISKEPHIVGVSINGKYPKMDAAKKENTNRTLQKIGDLGVPPHFGKPSYWWGKTEKTMTNPVVLDFSNPIEP